MDAVRLAAVPARSKSDNSAYPDEDARGNELEHTIPTALKHYQ